MSEQAGILVERDEVLLVSFPSVEDDDGWVTYPICVVGKTRWVPEGEG